MTATLAPYRSQQPRGRDGFAQLVRSEFTKFRTIRAWVITLVVAGVLVVGFAWIGAPHAGVCVSQSGSSPICATASVPSVPIGPGGEPVVDTFSFVHESMIGDGTLTARVTSLTAVGASGNGPGLAPGGGDLNLTPELVSWAKAGLIITSSVTQGSSYAAVMATPGHGTRMQSNYTSDVAGLPGAATPSSPRWLRLTRIGDAITGYDSLDGNHWTKIGVANLANLPRTVQVGLFVTSPFDYTNGSPTLATATFDQVRSAGDFPDRSSADEVVGANTQSYATWPTGRNWFKHADGTFTISGSGDIAPEVGGGALGPGGGETRSLLAGGTFGLIAVIVLATLFITAEYRRGLIRTTFSASPRRGRVLAAKAVVIGSVSFVVGSIATAVAEAVSRHVLAHQGNYVFPLSAPTEIRVILGTGLLFALVAIGILALATVLRRSAGAVVAGIVAFVLPFIIFSAPGSSGAASLLRVTPVAGFAIQGTLPRFAQVAGDYTMGSGYYPLTPWVGLAVLGAWAAVALGAAMWSLRHRDV